jgi:hypothetical protein
MAISGIDGVYTAVLDGDEGGASPVGLSEGMNLSWEGNLSGSMNLSGPVKLCILEPIRILLINPNAPSLFGRFPVEQPSWGLPDQEP